MFDYNSILLKKMQDFNRELNQTSLLLHKERFMQRAIAVEPIATSAEVENLKKIIETGTDKQKFEAAVSVVEDNIPNVFEPPAPVLTEAVVAKAIAVLNKRSFMEIMAEKKKAQEAEQLEEIVPAQQEAPVAKSQTVVHEAASGKVNETFALNITLNEKQLAAANLAFAGKDFVITGPAGSGKTTTQRAVAKKLYDTGNLGTTLFKTYDPNGKKLYANAPGVAFCAFTRRAAANLQKALFKDPDLLEIFKFNVMTVHTLLEFEPATDEVEEENEFGIKEQTKKFRFLPMRTAENKLTIKVLVIEESSMIDAISLWGYLFDALPDDVQIIFIGDLNQLPPVFGASILNYAVTQLPVVELTEVYRNQGIVLENAHHILKGETLVENTNFQIVRGSSSVQVGPSKTAYMLGREQGVFHKLYHASDARGRLYDPDQDIILSPWNKHELGTDNMNKWIAQFIGAERKAIVHEVIAGFNKHYLAVGDKVMVNRLDGVITDIVANHNYFGKGFQAPGSDLTRFGTRIIGAGKEDEVDDDFDLDYDNFNIDDMEDEKIERKQQASHLVKVKLENGKEEIVSAAGDFAPQVFSLGYCLTVHKAQGSEWRKVYLIMHKTHAVSLYRELFYTAVTRAKTDVILIAKDSVINGAIKSQRIKGNTLKDKIMFFNSGVQQDPTISASIRFPFGKGQ